MNTYDAGGTAAAVAIKTRSLTERGRGNDSIGN